MQNNLTYIPYYQPISPSISFQQTQVGGGSHQIGYPKQLSTISGQQTINPTLVASTNGLFPNVPTGGINFSTITPYPSNPLIHQKQHPVLNTSTSPQISFLKSPQTNATSQNGNLANSAFMGNLQLDLSLQNSQANLGSNPMLNSKHSKSPTKGTTTLPVLRSSSSKRSNEVSMDKQLEIRNLFSKTFTTPPINISSFDNKSSSIGNLVHSFQFPSSNLQPAFSDSQGLNNQNNKQDIQIIKSNGLFEVKYDSLHSQSAVVLQKLKNKELTLENLKQLILEVKDVESKFSTLYSQLCNTYETQLLGKQPTKQSINTILEVPESSSNISSFDNRNNNNNNPNIIITPIIESQNKSSKKVPESLKFTGEYDPKTTYPHTATAAMGSKEEKRIPILSEDKNVKIVVNEIKGDSSIQTYENNQKIFKTETSDDLADQYSKEELKKRFLEMNDDNNNQLLIIPDPTKKKSTNSPKKYSFDLAATKDSYQSSDEIELLIQRYRQSGMSKSAHHEPQQGEQQQNQQVPKSISQSYTTQDSSEIQQDKSDQDGKALQVYQKEGKRKLSDIQESSRDNTERKNNNRETEQDESNNQQQASGLKSQSPQSNKNSKKSTTQELMDRVNNVLQRSDQFLQKHSDKKFKRQQSRTNTLGATTVEEATKSSQPVNQSEYDQSSEIRAIMEQAKKKQEVESQQQQQQPQQQQQIIITPIQENPSDKIKQNLFKKFSSSSQDNDDLLSKNKETRSISDYRDNKVQSVAVPGSNGVNRASIQNLAEILKLAQENSPQSNIAVHGSEGNSTTNKVNTPSSILSLEPISHEVHAAKSTFSKALNNISEIPQFSSFAYSSPKNTFGIDVIQTKSANSMNNSPKDFKSDKLLSARLDEIIGDAPSKQISHETSSFAPSVLQSPQIPHSFTSYSHTSPAAAANLNETANNIKLSEKSQNNSTNNSQIQNNFISAASSPKQSQILIDKLDMLSPRSFIETNNLQSFKSPEVQNIQNKSQQQSTSTTNEKKDENLNSYARNIGQSGVFTPSSVSSNKSAAIHITANQIEIAANNTNTINNNHNDDQPSVNPFLKEVVSSDNVEHSQLQVVNLKQLESSQSMYCPLYDEVDPFNYSISNFVVGKKLGHGKFADVFAAVDKHTGYRVALKQIKKDTIKEFNLYQDILNEIKVQSALRHPNLIQLFGFFIDNDSIYLIQELALGKELFNELKSTVYKKFTENVAAFYVRQVIEALIYMHSKNVVHRDLKPENIMVYNGLLKICDFGYAAVVQKNKMRNTFCGTLDYVSPEMVQGKAYDFSVDVWSVGILTYELIIGYAPFAGKNHDATFDQIVNGELRFSGPISFDAGDFISRILEREPNSRMNLSQALQHPFIQNEYIRRLQSEKGGEIDFSDFSKL